MNKFLKWGGIVFAVLFVFAVIGAAMSDESSTTSSTQDNPAKTSEKKENTTQPVNTDDKNQQEVKKEEPKKEVLEVNARTFVGEFDKNQLAAEEKYKGKIIKTSAYIDNISEDILGNPFLSLNPSSDKYYVGTSMQCYFDNKSELTDLENGQKVTVIGKVDEQSLGIISIKDCKVVE